MRTPLQKDEKILLVTFSSWTSLVLPFFIALIGVVVSYFIGFLDHYGWIAAVVGILFFLLRYYSWKVNIWVVTNFRVVDETGLLSHYAKESPLDKINNVSYDQTFAGRIFNFGHVEIQTAAQVGATDYYNVNHPKRLKDTITAAQSAYKDWQFNSQALQMAAAIQGARGNGGAYRETMNAQGAGSNLHAPGIAGELEKLFELRQKGALSEEEYQRAKTRLLNH